MTSNKSNQGAKKPAQKNNAKKGMNLSANNSKISRVSAPAAQSVQRQTSFSMRSLDSKKGSIRIHGQDLLSSFQIASGYTLGQNILTLSVNPLELHGTRLEKFAEMYEKFVFRRLKFHIQSGFATSTIGQLVLSYDRDFADTTPEPSVDGLREHFSMAGTKSGNLWESFSIDCPLSDTQDFYYTNDTGYEGRLVYQGQVYVTAGSALSSSSGGSLIWVEYEIDLYDPQLDSHAATARVNTDVGGNTPSGTSAGWNNVNVTDKIQLPLKWITNSTTGNKGFQVPEGSWGLIQELLTTGSSLNGWLAPTVDKINPASRGDTLITNLDNWLAGGANGNAFRFDKIDVPSGGAFMYGNATGINTYNNLRVRLFSLAEKFLA